MTISLFCTVALAPSRATPVALFVTMLSSINRPVSAAVVPTAAMPACWFKSEPELWTVKPLCATWLAVI